MSSEEKPSSSAYKHLQESVQRPDVGVEAQFPNKKPPKTYRYDSSLAPELCWDENAERPFAEWLLTLVAEAAEKGDGIVFAQPQVWEGTQEKFSSLSQCAARLKSLTKPFLNWAGKAERRQIAVPTLPLFVHERHSTQAILETLRERLQELDPAHGDLSLYRTRQLVPPHRMEELRRGEVMIANWHRLAKRESNTVNGDSAKVVKTGEPVEVVKNAGKENESVEVKYFESDAAWFKRIRQELGSGKGRSPHWLIFNDESHHAYRRGDVSGEEQTLDEDKDLAKKNEREATIWIEGLDRINKLAGGSRKRGINLCVDLSATPFYIQGSGNEVGKPFPWIVSDFGLLDAIESGLVKIPQLPSRDVTGADEAAYFNIWRWVQAKAEEEGYVPDFIVETDSALNVMVEIKGQLTDDAEVKSKAAQRWVNAVNRLGQHGTWHYLLVTDPGALGVALNAYAAEKWDEGQLELE